MGNRLTGKVAIITGAGDGMGKASAIRFAQEGCKVVVAEINDFSGLAVVNEILDMGGDALFVKTDIGDESTLRYCVNKTIETYGRIDVLYNNAAVGGSIFKNTNSDNAPLWETDLDDWNKLMELDVTGIYLMLKEVIPHMIKQKSGVIINAGSANALQAVNNVDAYTAAKGAIVSLTRTLASRLGRYGVRVNCLSPGGVRTRFLTNNEENIVSDRTTDFFRTIPLRRIGEVGEIANTALFLASDESSYITGVVLPVDGGWNTI
jgi:NAD(P)-dependent dehydrogenase (short-subunit alcohol dehydrogenase family)